MLVLNSGDSFPAPMLDVFASKTVLITGASSGLGKAIAEHLMGSRAVLLLTSSAKSELESLALTGQNSGGPILLYPQDFSAFGAAQLLHDRILDTGYVPDVVINHVDLNKISLCTAEDPELCTQIMAGLCQNTKLITRLCLPDMLKRNQGWILNVVTTCEAASERWPTCMMELTRDLQVDLEGTNIHLSALFPSDLPFTPATAHQISLQLFDVTEPAHVVASMGLQSFMQTKRRRKRKTAAV